MHPAYGFQQSLFEPDFRMTEQIGWGLNDHDFLQQMVPHLEGLPQPFAAWMITLSLHHPFADFPAAHKVLKLGALEGSSFGNYLHTMHFFDEALDAFIAALTRDGLLESSVVVVFGDHDAGFSHSPGLARTIGIAPDDVTWTRNDRIPLFIRLPAASRSTDQLSGVRARPAGQVDVAPTILGLLGIDAAALPYLGRNLLGAAADVAVRPYGDWLDAHHLFLARGSASICYGIIAQAPAPLSDCADADAASRRARDLSRLVIVDDLQERLGERLAAAIR
jgi:lipoteichoic acid synthase